jgi:nicotinate-nucleotide adenylyltransferase
MIGIYGGSFDPVHLGHLKTATSIKNELDIERLFLLPCYQPVHKQSLNYSSEQRLEMLSLAIQDFPELEIDTREILREGSSFMIDTLIELVEEFNNHTICLIIGMDSFINFKTWKQWDEFADLVHMVVLPRSGNQPDKKSLDTFDLAKDKDHLKSELTGLLYFSNSKLINISSSDIRDKIANDQNLDQLVPSSVINLLQKI